MIQLAVNEVEKGFSIYQILNGVSFEVQERERVALIGKNGTGKTTLFKIIMGIEPQDKGDIFIRKGAKLGYVEQIPHYDKEVTVRDVLKMAFKEQLKLRAEMHKLEEAMAQAEEKELERLLHKYGETCQVFESQGGYEIEEQLNRMIEGLQFKASFLNKPFMSLSGGEKTTVLLGKVLLENPDILLLDEPTNHLDVRAMEWLEAYLRSYRGAVLMISHDRYFLDQVATKVVELERGKATTFYGNYTAYAEEKERILLAEFEAYEDQQKKIKAMEKAIKRLRIWAAQGDNEDLFKKAACMQKRLEKMEKLEKPVLEAAQMALTFNETERSGKDVLSLSGVGKAFEQKKLFDNLEWHVYYKERIALIGENGCGKSTLIKMILGEETQDQGTISLGTRLKVAYLPQQIHFPNEELTVLEAFKVDVVMTETKARQTLAKFLFYGESVFKKVKDLSGGEKSRLLLCKLIQEDINLLILDEPTNHLDIDSRENLEEALQSFNGTLVFISHDRYFINKLATRVSEIKGYGITNYLGNYEYYKEKSEKQVGQQKNEVKDTTRSMQKEEITQEKVHKERKSSPNMFKIRKLEEDIEHLEAKQKEVSKLLEEAANDYIKYLEFEKESHAIQVQLDTAMKEWLELQEV